MPAVPRGRAPSTQDLEPAARHRWEPALRGLRAEALDCLQTTVGLLADDVHGTGTHLGLGSRWPFPTLRRDGVVRLRPTLQDRLDDAAELLGLRVAAPQGPTDGQGLRRQLEVAGSLYVVADAYDLPWVPYAGHRLGGQKVAGGGLEELQHGRVFEGGGVRHIDDHRGAFEGGGESLAGERVDA